MFAVLGEGFVIAGPLRRWEPFFIGHDFGDIAFDSVVVEELAHEHAAITRRAHLFLERIGAFLAELVVLLEQRFFERFVFQEEGVHGIDAFLALAEEAAEAGRLLSIILDFGVQVFDLFHQGGVFFFQGVLLVLVNSLEAFLGGEEFLLLAGDEARGADGAHPSPQPITNEEEHGRADRREGNEQVLNRRGIKVDHGHMVLAPSAGVNVQAPAYEVGIGLKGP